MSKSRSDFKSSKLTNIDTRGGPIKEGLAPVATNYLFSGTGALRLHRPPAKPLFTKRREYCQYHPLWLVRRNQRYKSKFIAFLVVKERSKRYPLFYTL